MPAIARKTDPILGTTAGEHTGHVASPHTPIPNDLSGTITSNCEETVIVNGLALAVVTSKTTETDSCCAGVNNGGTIDQGSPNVFAGKDKKAVARVNDHITPHSGSANVLKGSHNVFVNGE